MAFTVRHNSTSNEVTALLPKFGDLDSDIRFMSLVDLCNLLKVGPPTLLLNDFATAARVVDCVMASLDDTNGDVQSQALKVIGPLALRSPPEMLCPLIEKLTNVQITRSMDQSIPATATRTLVTALPRPVLGMEESKAVKDAYTAISKVLIPRLLGYLVIPHGLKGLPDPPRGMLELDPEKGADLDTIDLLNETVRCFGPMLQESEKQAFLRRLIDILGDEHTGNVAKKKVLAAISVLAVYMSELTLSAFISSLVQGFQEGGLAPTRRRILISLTGSVARSIPRRFGIYIGVLAPFVLRPLSKEEYDEATVGFDEDSTVDVATDEVKEAALVTLDDLLASCGNEMRPFTEEALDSSLRYVAYDPTLAFNEDDEDMGGTQSTNDDEDHEEAADLDDEEFEEEGAISDGDDSSWKIRRCATKVLYTMISTRGSGDLLENGILYDKVAPVLIKCFKEREENVRLEILATLTTLIKKTGSVIPATTNSFDDVGLASESLSSKSRKRRRVGSDAGVFVDHLTVATKGLISPMESPSPTSGPRADLARLGRSIVRVVVKLLRQSSVPTKQAAMSLLKAFVIVRHGGLMEDLEQIIDPMMAAIRTPSSFVGAHSVVSAAGAASATGNSLRIEALQLLRAICNTHSSRVIAPFMGRVIPGLVIAVKDSNFKISGEAIGVAESVVMVITPPRSSGNEDKLNRYLEDVFDVILDKVRLNETDLEVRQSAIQALGVIIARASGSVPSKSIAPLKRSAALDTLLERLKNETTRKSAVRAIDSIALTVKEKAELEPSWIRCVALELASQLRKSDRALRNSSLSTLKHLTGNSASVNSLDDKTIQHLGELLVPIVDADSLSLLGTAMSVLTDLTKQNPHAVSTVPLIRALSNVVVTPLAGHVLEAFLMLVSVIGSQGVGGPLMQAFLKDVGVTGDPGIVGSAIGTLLVFGGSSVGVSIDEIVNELRNTENDQRKCLALSILGEASLQLGTSSPLQPNDFLSYFTSKSDQVPRAAAVALGRAGAGNTSLYLPTILSRMEQSGNTQLLLLHSVKEVLQYASESRSDISKFTEGIWRMLMKTTDVEDNRATGAECVGRLISIEPTKYLPQLQSYLKDATPSIRGMVIQAIRFALTDTDDAFDEVLRPILVGMLSTMLNDSVLDNRRLALITLNSATQNKAPLILPHLKDLLPLVIKESEINEDLIREVQMGPFKHKVDDGLEIRKSAYETLHLLMDAAFPRMSTGILFNRVIDGLKDDHDIKMLCNLMLTKLAALDPDATMQNLDSIAERFQSILCNKLKDNAVKQDIEKAQEARTDALRVTVRLQNMLQAAPVSAGHSPAPVWRAYWEFVGKEFKTPLQTAASLVRHQR